MVFSADARQRSSISGEAEVNWDPIDQTVLANEQVIDGKDGDLVLM